MAGGIEFLLNGAHVRIDNCDPTRTLLDYLREDRRLTGTKEGCREGDCGACTVTVAALGDEGLKVRAVNACILLLPMLDRTAIYTVEGISSAGEPPHPIQTALVESHGSQCGFCTPGFVMSLYAADLAGEQPDRRRLNEILAGNLCRCTGYGPIIDAAERASDKTLAREALLAEIGRNLRALPRDAMLRLAHNCALTRTKRTYCAPHSLDELFASMDEQPSAAILAGCTDLGLMVTKQHSAPKDIIDINRVPQLRQISQFATELSIGAAVTYSEARTALAGRFPAINAFLSRIASKQIRNSGTIGGNIANGSPIGDMPPALMALGARIELASKAGNRELALEDYFIRYGHQDRKPGEIITRVILPYLEQGAHFDAYKISKRFEQDISSVCGAFHLRLVDGIATDVRIAFGGMAGIPKRASAAEAVLEGQPLDVDGLDRAADALTRDFAPLSDHRASAKYRLLVAQNLVRKFYASITTGSVVRLDRETAA